MNNTILRLGAGNDCNSARKRFKTMSVHDAVYRHPDKGGDAALFAQLLDAWRRAERALCAPPRAARPAPAAAAAKAAKKPRATRANTSGNAGRNAPPVGFVSFNPMARHTPPVKPFFMPRFKRSFEPYKGLRPRASAAAAARR